jgi:hypothetical protein
MGCFATFYERPDHSDALDDCAGDMGFREQPQRPRFRDVRLSSSKTVGGAGTPFRICHCGYSHEEHHAVLWNSG